MEIADTRHHAERFSVVVRFTPSSGGGSRSWLYIRHAVVFDPLFLDVDMSNFADKKGRRAFIHFCRRRQWYAHRALPPAEGS